MMSATSKELLMESTRLQRKADGDVRTVVKAMAKPDELHKEANALRAK
jgi:hypothetical protein